VTGADLVELAARVGPVLDFLLAISVVAEISDRAVVAGGLALQPLLV
jgi:arsenical pump membrane protein